MIVQADLLGQIEKGIPAGVEVIVVPTADEVRDAYGLDEAACRAAPGARVWSDWIAGFAPWTEPPLAERGIMTYTSGTTGRPKGVVKPAMTADQSRTAKQISNIAYGNRPGRCFLLTGPCYHIAVIHSAFMVLIDDADLVITARFDAEEFLRLVERHQVTHAHMVPTMFHRLLKLPPELRAAHDVSSLKHIAHGAAPCSPRVKQAMIDWVGPILVEYYGGTENGMTHVCSSQDWLAHPGTVGRLTPGAAMRIVGESGETMAPGEVGEIYATSPMVPEFTYKGLADMRREAELDGLITIGDMGYVDEEGYLYLCDRKNDMVISGAVNIYPVEIEGVILAMEGVRDCAVFGIPDEEYGETLAAAIQPAEGARISADQVRAFVAERLAKYKVPRLVEFHADLPREDTGKIFKRKLRDPFWKDSGRSI